MRLTKNINPSVVSMRSFRVSSIAAVSAPFVRTPDGDAQRGHDRPLLAAGQALRPSAYTVPGMRTL